MKIVLILVVIIIVMVLVVQLFAMRGRRNIETYPYVVKKRYDTFEIRSYETTLFTSVPLTAKKYSEASRQGFSILAGYIFGGNERKEKIAMTSPVTMSLDDSKTMMFMIPKKFTEETLPKPNENRIEFKKVAAKTVAAISFGGWASDIKIQKYKEKLIASLEAQGISYTNRFYFLGYNPPFELINRKNDVIVELENYSL